MRQLKVQVESVVRPVRASVRRKMKMREELLAHLTASYQDGLANGLKEEDAVRRALERFGDPAAIRAELQASVPAVERILYLPFPFHDRMNKTASGLWVRRNGESPVHHTWRLWSLFASYVVGMDIILFACRLTSGMETLPLRQVALFAAAFQGAPLAWIFVYVLLLDEIQDVLRTVGSSARRGALIGGLCILSSGLIVGAGMSIRLLVGKNLDCSSPQLICGFAVAGVLTPAVLVWQAITLTAERKRRDEWENLILDD